jgi:hypothetical protein
MQSDAELREALPNALILLLDHGDADQVNGAGSNREAGQELKIDECYFALESAGLTGTLTRNQVVAFDALKDNREKLLSAVETRADSLRAKRNQELTEHTEDARTFLEGAGNELTSALRASVDKRIQSAMQKHVLMDAPLKDPLSGMYDAIRTARYASVVFATCRRNGRYSSLDLYAAVRAEAAKAATSWLGILVDPLLVSLDELLLDPTVSPVQEHVRLRRKQLQDGYIQVVRSYTNKVADEVEKLLSTDPIYY